MNSVFCSQVKFIFGTLGKRKSINYLVAMETLSSCYSPQARIQTGSSGFWKPVTKVPKNICVCKNIPSHNSIFSALDVICHTLSVNLEHFPQCSKLYQSHLACTRARHLPFSHFICQISEAEESVPCTPLLSFPLSQSDQLNFTAPNLARLLQIVSQSKARLFPVLSSC